MKRAYTIVGHYWPKEATEEVRFEDRVVEASAERAFDAWYQKHDSKQRLHFLSIDPLT